LEKVNFYSSVKYRAVFIIIENSIFVKRIENAIKRIENTIAIYEEL